MVSPDVAVDPPGRWRALALLGVAVLLAMTTWFSASAVVPQLAAQWDLGASAKAWLTIAVQLGFVAGALLSAVFTLADVLAPQRVFLLGALGAALANGLLLLVTSAAPAISLRFVTGALLAGVYPPAMKLMATWFKRERGLALGVMVGALTMGSALPHLINALGGLDWRIVVGATSALTVAGGLIAETLVKDGPFAFAKGSFDPRRMGDVLRDERLRLASFGYFGHMWELYAMWAWIVVFYSDAIAERGGESGALAPLLAFLTIAIGAAGSIVGGRLADRRGRSWLTSVSLILSGLSSITIGLIWDGPLWLVAAVGLFWGFWVVADSAQFSAVVTEVADQRYVGTALTVQLALGFTLTGVTIWLIPILRDAVTWRWAFAILAPGTIFGTWAMQRLARLNGEPTLFGRQTAR